MRERRVFLRIEPNRGVDCKRAGVGTTRYTAVDNLSSPLPHLYWPFLCYLF